MKYVQKLIKFASIFLICGITYGDTVEPIVGAEAEGTRPTVRQWNEFQDTQEQLLKENIELKGRVGDLITGQKRLLNRLINIDANFLNLVNIVNETNNIVQGSKNCPFMGSKDKPFFQGTLYVLSGLGVISVFVWGTGLLRKK